MLTEIQPVVSNGNVAQLAADLLLNTLPAKLLSAVESDNVHAVLASRALDRFAHSQTMEGNRIMNFNIRSMTKVKFLRYPSATVSSCSNKELRGSRQV